MPYLVSDVAKDCCSKNLGLVAGGPSSSTWLNYCCYIKNYNDDSWAFPSSSYAGCCSKRSRSNVYWYKPSGFSGTEACPAGGDADKCSDYKYTSKGFYCGYEDSCKAWIFQGGTQPTSTLNSCCTTAKSNSWSYSTSSCCTDATFKSDNLDICCGTSGTYDKTCCDYYKSKNYTSNKTSCCNVSAFKSANNASGQWCYTATSTPTTDPYYGGGGSSCTYFVEASCGSSGCTIMAGVPSGHTYNYHLKYALVYGNSGTTCAYDCTRQYDNRCSCGTYLQAKPNAEPTNAGMNSNINGSTVSVSECALYKTKIQSGGMLTYEKVKDATMGGRNFEGLYTGCSVKYCIP